MKGLAALTVLGALAGPVQATKQERCRWFVLPITVAAHASDGGTVPVHCNIDFTELLKGLKAAGAVDEATIQLFREGKDGKDEAVQVQFRPAAQAPLPKRRLPADAPPSVSYLAEYPAAETPPVRVAGKLTWLHRTEGDERPTKYRLVFGVPRTGYAVQVPYPPYNLRWFDENRRASRPAFAFMQVRPPRPLGGTVHFHAGEELLASYHLGPTTTSPAPGTPRRPFLYPVHGPGGVPLTAFGKTHDPTGSHDHHYSLWIAHASVNGHDFWSEKGGVIVHKQLAPTEDGPVYCRLVHHTAWMHGDTAVMAETRTLTAYRPAADFRLLDIDLDYMPAGKEPVTLGKTSFGFLAVRVAPSLSVFDGGGETVNSRGDRNERGAHLHRADWLDQSGPVAEGQWAGIAVLSHPDNPGHPCGWHCRNDGWAGAAFAMERPFILRDGEKLRLRYRLVLHKGNAEDGHIAARWKDWSMAAPVTLGDASPLD